MKLIRTFMVFFVFATIQPALLQAQNDYSGSIVQVLVTFQEYDAFQPWQKKNIGMKIGYGVVVGPSEIITTENLVRNNTLVELRKAGSGEKITASVVLSDEQANLAVIRITDGARHHELSPLQLAESSSRNGDVTMLQFDETAQIQKGKAQIVQAAMKSLPTAPYPALAFTILTELNINGEGAVALRDGKINGLVMSYDRSSRTGSMIPSITLKHFITRSRQTPYRGFASAGFIWTPLVDPAKRKYYNVNTPKKGILVLDFLPESGASASIAPNDVIIEWDNYSIDDLGFYEDPDFGRLAFSYLVTGRRLPGDTVPVKIIRNGQETNVTVILDRRSDSSSLVPDNVTREREEYIVEGGFIIRELSGAYLQSYGQDWQRNIDPRIVNIYLTKRFHPENPGDKIVILAAVLPDPINVGYQQFKDDIITRINNRPVRNMADVFKVLEKDGNITRVSIQSMAVDLVLDPAMLTDANDELARLYRIPSMRYQRKSLK